jgi:hypothetical protein
MQAEHGLSPDYLGPLGAPGSMPSLFQGDDQEARIKRLAKKISLSPI